MINIPRYFPQLTKENLQKEIDENVLVGMDPIEHATLVQTVKERRKIEIEELKQIVPEKIPIRILYHRSYSPEDVFKKSLQNPAEQKNIQMVVEVKEETKEENSFFGRLSKWKMDFESFVKGSGKNDNEIKKELQEIIIHIHGGGFVSMSSGSHQNYTRRWANMLKRPVFSIDYRLAPEYPFPAALDDCWQFYNWIVAFGKDLLGI